MHTGLKRSVFLLLLLGMIGLNHALTGGLVALTVPLPAALPIAFASHFVLDMLPHYGIPHNQRDTSKTWRIVTTLDFITTFGLAIFVLLTRPELALILCPLLATLPDYVWVFRVIKYRSFQLDQPKDGFSKWHASIQHERPWGLWFELAILLALIYLVFVAYW